MTEYEAPRAHALRVDCYAVLEGEELPVPVESIAEDRLGLVALGVARPWEAG